MSGFIPALLSLGVIASALLIVAGIFAIRKHQDRKRGWLMIVAGLTTLGNVYLYATMPAVPAMPEAPRSDRTAPSEP